MASVTEDILNTLRIPILHCNKESDIHKIETQSKKGLMTVLSIVIDKKTETEIIVKGKNHLETSLLDLNLMTHVWLLLSYLSSFSCIRRNL